MPKPGLAYEKPSRVSQVLVIGFSLAVIVMAGWLVGEKAMMESLIAFKRAGACGVLSYFALRVAQALKSAR